VRKCTDNQIWWKTNRWREAVALTAFKKALFAYAEFDFLS